MKFMHAHRTDLRQSTAVPLQRGIYQYQLQLYRCTKFSTVRLFLSEVWPISPKKCVLEYKRKFPTRFIFWYRRKYIGFFFSALKILFIDYSNLIKSDIQILNSRVQKKSRSIYVDFFVVILGQLVRYYSCIQIVTFQKITPVFDSQFILKLIIIRLVVQTHNHQTLPGINVFCGQPKVLNQTNSINNLKNKGTYRVPQRHARCSTYYSCSILDNLNLNLVRLCIYNDTRIKSTAVLQT